MSPRRQGFFHRRGLVDTVARADYKPPLSKSLCPCGPKAAGAPEGAVRMSLKMGLIGRKIGMTQVFHEDGSALGVTAVSVGPCVVVGKRTADKHGYSAVQIGFEEAPIDKGTHLPRLPKPELGYFKKASVEKPVVHLKEVRLEPKDLEKYEVGKI